MFAQLKPETARNQRRIVAGSLVLHAALFAWLLHAPEPRLLMPTSVSLGRNGKVVTRIYWPSQLHDDSTTSSPENASEIYRHQRLGHEKLIWKPTATPPKMTAPRSTLAPSAVEDNSKTATLSKLGHGATAGPSLRKSCRADRYMAMRSVLLCPSLPPIPLCTLGNGRTPRAKSSSKS